MQTEHFESSLISLVLSWIFCLPVFVAVVVFGLNNALAKHEGVSWGVTVWICFCFLGLSPFRYLVFQTVLGICYPWQSLRAFLSAWALVLYVPFTFGLLYGLCLGLPFYTSWYLVRKYQGQPWSYRGALALIPVLCLAGCAVFFYALPWFCRTTHWLKAEDALGATRGPAYLTYRVLSLDFPFQRYPKYCEKEIDLLNQQTQKPGPRTAETESWRSKTKAMPIDRMMQAHVASLYLNRQEHMKFVERIFPHYYQWLMTQEGKAGR